MGTLHIAADHTLNIEYRRKILSTYMPLHNSFFVVV